MVAVPIKLENGKIMKGRNKDRWDIVRAFENAYREKSLRGLTMKRALKIFSDLHRFAIMAAPRDYYKKVNTSKMRSLLNARALLRKAG